MFKISPKDKFFLLKQNPVFCTAPWNLLYVYPDGTIKTCVAGREILGNLLTDSIDSILQNHQSKKIKHDMLAEVLPKNCTKCMKLENQGNGQSEYQYLRNNYNELCRHVDTNYLDTNEFVLGALDLHWSSICNLKCVTCWAKQSSSIAKEQGIPVRHLPNHKYHEFIDWVVNNQATLKEIYLSGGEPMLIRYNEKLLSRLDKRHDLQIRVNSNLMWQTDNAVLKQVLEFPNVLFTCSADNVGKKFNYIRRNADWSKFLENLKFLQKQNHVRIRINMVFFAASALDLVDTIDYFVTHFAITDFTINQCGMGQTQIRARNLPVSAKKICQQRLLDAIQKYHHNLNLVGQFNNCLTELEQPNDESFIEYFDHIDYLAGTDWRSTFGDMA